MTARGKAAVYPSGGAIVLSLKDFAGDFCDEKMYPDRNRLKSFSCFTLYTAMLI